MVEDSHPGAVTVGLQEGEGVAFHQEVVGVVGLQEAVGVPEGVFHQEVVEVDGHLEAGVVGVDAPQGVVVGVFHQEMVWEVFRQEVGEGDDHPGAEAVGVIGLQGTVGVVKGGFHQEVMGVLFRRELVGVVFYPGVVGVIFHPEAVVVVVACHREVVVVDDNREVVVRVARQSWNCHLRAEVARDAHCRPLATRKLLPSPEGDLSLVSHAPLAWVAGLKRCRNASTHWWLWKL